MWSPAVGVTVRLKLEESGDATHTVETDAVTTVAEEWETLSFDFSKPATNDGNPTNALNTDYTFDTLSIFFNYGVAGVGETYYYDDIKFIGQGADTDPEPSTAVDLSEAFGGTTIGDGSLYTYPAGTESWAGFANKNEAIYPITLAEDSVITFTGSVPTGGDVDVRFRFEFKPHPDVDPAYDTSAVTVSGADSTTYSIAVPSQGSNTFSSFLMYLNTQDVGVVVTDVTIAAAPSTAVDYPKRSVVRLSVTVHCIPTLLVLRFGLVLLTRMKRPTQLLWLKIASSPLRVRYPQGGMLTCASGLSSSHIQMLILRMIRRW